VWGKGASGALGNGTTTNRSSPVQVGILSDWLRVSASDYGFIATKTNGSIWGSGYDNYMGSAAGAYRSSPVQVGAQTTDWASISRTRDHGFGIKYNGTLWAWGNNGDGKLGLGTTTNVGAAQQVGALTTWYQVCAGQDFTAAIKTDGTLWSWGSNGSGKLGLNIATTTYRSSPVQVGALTTWYKVVTGAGYTYAIKTDGTLWAWGGNTYGQLLLGDTANRSSPVQVGALTTWINVPDNSTHDHTLVISS